MCCCQSLPVLLFYWVILHDFLSSTEFFVSKSTFSKKKSGMPSECQTVWINIWVQTVLQRLSTEDTNRQMVNIENKLQQRSAVNGRVLALGRGFAGSRVTGRHCVMSLIKTSA